MNPVKKIIDKINVILGSSDPAFISSFIESVVSGVAGISGMMKGDIVAVNDILDSVKSACKMNNITKAKAELKKLEKLLNRVSSNMQLEISKVISSH